MITSPYCPQTHSAQSDLSVLWQEAQREADKKELEILRSLGRFVGISAGGPASRVMLVTFHMTLMRWANIGPR